MDRWLEEQSYYYCFLAQAYMFRYLYTSHPRDNYGEINIGHCIIAIFMLFYNYIYLFVCSFIC